MFTKKSLIVGIVLVLSVLCAGTMGAFASSVTPTTPHHNIVNPYLSDGIAAIPPADNDEILKPLDVQQYLVSQGCVAGTTVDGNAPIIQTLKLTNLSKLKQLANLVIPGVVGDKQVYYAQLKGPFTLDQNLPLPVIGTLIPSANNMVVLGHMPLLNDLSNLGGLPALSNLANTLNGDLMDNLPILSNLTDSDFVNSLKSLANNPPTTQGVSSPGVSVGPDLTSVYEVFDALNGHLLAWG